MGVLDTTYTFQATDTITSSKLNNIIDQTTFTNDAIQGTTLQVVSPGKLAVSAGGITSNELATNAVTTNAILDGSVTPAKLSTGGPSWSGAGGTFTLSQGAIELGNGISSNNNSFIDFHSSFPIIDHDARIIRESGANGTFTISNIGTGSIIFSASGGVTFGSANMPNPVGTAPLFGVRAWVNFNGTSGSTAIRQSGNVSTVTRNAVGRYTITFATAMQDTNYAIVAFARDANATDGNYFVSALSNSTKTTSSVQVEVNSPGGSVDSPEINIMVIR
jgi:hypothetical protein